MVEPPIFTFRNFVRHIRERENERKGTGSTSLRAHISRTAVSIENFGREIILLLNSLIPFKNKSLISA